MNDSKKNPHSLPAEVFRQILESLDDMVLVKGPKSKMLWANRAFREFYGMSEEQLHGIIDAPFSNPDHTQQYVEHDNYVYESRKALDIPREPCTRHDGVVRQMHTVKSPIYDDAGRTVMTVGISRDITDRIEGEKLKEEQRAHQMYSDRLQALSAMAGGMAHEINTPLSVILTLSDQLREIVEERGFDRDVFISSTKVIADATMKISRLISDLQTFSRESAREKFDLVDIRDVVNMTLSLCRQRIQSKGIRFDVTMPQKNLIVNCSRTQLSQVLLNLCMNAQDAIARIPSPWISVEVKDSENKIEISVTDCGSGVPLEYREKIFRPFFTTKDVGQGPGLGLSVSRSLIQGHGGTLEYDDKAANTVFRVTLPRVS
ncbi:MAG TPA: ATP-binding protein [Bdellovibrionales bacterium]|nr:ATP-binding protein [Bdellovibrionales bacterium]